MTINDTKFSKLGLLGYTGSLADRSARYRLDNGIVKWSDWYKSQGIDEPHVSDAALVFWTELSTQGVSDHSMP